MRICFTLDDVIRAKSDAVRVEYFRSQPTVKADFYDKDFTTNEYYKELNFKTKEAYNNFLYNDHVFEIFGDSKLCSQSLDKFFNNWYLRVKDDDKYGEDEVIFANRGEFGNSISFTLFFLYRTAIPMREYHFPVDSKTIWDKCDVLITADPFLLENKPEGKITVKIETSYNKNCSADYTYDKCISLIKDNNFLSKIHGDYEQDK